MRQSMHIGIESKGDRGCALIEAGERASRPEHLKRPHPGEVFKRRCMAKSPLKQSEVAQCLEVSTKHLSRFVNGHSNLTVEFARKLEAVSGKRYKCQGLDALSGCLRLVSNRKK
ncbi:helix-turn-helix transcriptional regulator [Alteromonas mediterranea]|uniref:XRE family transcriptional regulator n=1 Tax=Alteromonas mediterranea (strain DSM 17117 / CIP 110805 / LMG 28347 / Deep ecotype) TaxID=1774373 RepID=F2G756_ALTMD|nr:transcriptional regulator [Alteromonas mediterranea]AEA99729.1 XRE family transcriptional regulator [Alteromonas mediterranea DE]CAH1189403.1 hypothetical protein ISS312_00527 [Alteromonas mediterranea]